MTNAAAPQHFTDGSFDSEVVQSDQPVLVDFYADWCGPCQLLTPTIEGVAEQVGDSAKVGKLNIDENPKTAQAYGVSSIPTVLVFRNGKVVDKLVGVHAQDRYVAALQA